MNKSIFFFLLLAGFYGFGQNKNTGSVVLRFDNVAGNEDLVLKDKLYTNGAGESFNVSLFQYFVSNIKLQKADGKEYVLPQDESYFLVRESNPQSQVITIPNVPKGKYVGVSFVIGVDSLRNTKDISERKGTLDVGGEAKDMYWSWNSGYIHLKLEGTSPNIKVDSVRKSQRYAYHIGLFGGYNKPTLNNVRTAAIAFGGESVKVSKSDTPEIKIEADILRILNGPTTLSIVKNPSVMASPISQKVADNYVNLFQYKGVTRVAGTTAKSSSGDSGKTE